MKCHHKGDGVRTTPIHPEKSEIESSLGKRSEPRARGRVLFSSHILPDCLPARFGGYRRD